MQLPSKNSPPLKIETQAPSPLFENLFEDSTPLQADMQITLVWKQAIPSFLKQPYFSNSTLFLEKSESILFQKFWKLNLVPLLRRRVGGGGPTMIHLCQLLWSWFFRILSEWLIITHWKIYFWVSSPCFGFAIQTWF